MTSTLHPEPRPLSPASCVRREAAEPGLHLGRAGAAFGVLWVAPAAVPGRCCSLRREQTWDAAGGNGVGRLPAGEGGFQPGGTGSGHPFPQRIAAVLARQLVAELRCPQLFTSDRCTLQSGVLQLVDVGKKVQKGVPMLFSSLESELYNFCFAVDPE